MDYADVDDCRCPAMLTATLMMERWFMKAILHDHDGGDDDIKTTTMVLMLMMLVMLMPMMIMVVLMLVMYIFPFRPLISTRI